MQRFEEVRWPKLILLVLGCLGAGGIGSIGTVNALKEWYPSLEKPSFNPPNGVFGPVWTTLYMLMGMAVYLVSEQGDDDAAKEMVRRAEWLFALQLGLNVGWSFLFFSLRSPLAALVEIVLLWIAIVLTIRSFARVSKPAAFLMIPYLLWTTFAAFLNASIWWLNRNSASAA